MPRLEPDRLLDDLDPEQREAVARDERPGRDPRRRRHRQDAGDQPADGVRDRDRRRAAGPGAGRHVHRQGRGRDGRAAARARPAGRHGADVPRPRAAASCATSGRRATTARRCPQLLDSKIPILGRLGAPAARATTGSRRRRTSPTRSSGRSRAGSARATYEREVARVAPGREPPIPVDLFVRTFDDYERAKARAGPDRLRRPPRRDRRLLEDDAEAADDRPRPQALVQRRRVPGHEPAPAAAARAVARRPAATCASSATTTRRSTRSPARRRTYLTDVRRAPRRAPACST